MSESMISRLKLEKESREQRRKEEEHRAQTVYLPDFNQGKVDGAARAEKEATLWQLEVLEAAREPGRPDP
jgi:hypothetical protein